MNKVKQDSKITIRTQVSEFGTNGNIEKRTLVTNENNTERCNLENFVFCSLFPNNLGLQVEYNFIVISYLFTLTVADNPSIVNHLDSANHSVLL